MAEYTTDLALQKPRDPRDSTTGGPGYQARTRPVSTCTKSDCR